VQNAAAFLVSRARRHDHITPVLVSLYCMASSTPANHLQDGGACVEVSTTNTTQFLATWLTCVCRPTPCVHGRRQLRSTASRTLLVPRARTILVSAASPSMDHEHGTVCHTILEHQSDQVLHCAPSSVISRRTCFSSSLRYC